MDTIEILYIIVGACVVVVTVTIVWLANETMKLVKSLRRSSEDVEFMTREVKEKVLMVSEALDRAGTAASNIISLVEDAIEGIKARRDQLADSIGLVTGVGEYFKNRRAHKEEKEEKEKDKETEKLVEEIAEKPVKKAIKELEVEPKREKEPVRNASQSDAGGAKPKKEKIDVDTKETKEEAEEN